MNRNMTKLYFFERTSLVTAFDVFSNQISSLTLSILGLDKTCHVCFDSCIEVMFISWRQSTSHNIFRY